MIVIVHLGEDANLDNEEEGVLCIGSAGGSDTDAEFKYTPESTPNGMSFFKIFVGGLSGGHSGGDIHLQRGNANKILFRILWKINKLYDLRIAAIDGGDLRNAIPREAFAVVAVPKMVESDFKKLILSVSESIRTELIEVDPGLKVTLTNAENQKYVLDKSTQNKLLDAIIACPNGVIRMVDGIPGLVETSTNLGSIKTIAEEHKIRIISLQRSSVDSAKANVANMVGAVFNLAGASIAHTKGYPGWKADLKSPLLQLAKSAYQELFKKEAKIMAVHAGLECGFISGLYPEMKIVSFGPTILGAHSPDERLEINSVTKFWELLVFILKKL